MLRTQPVGDAAEGVALARFDRHPTVGVLMCFLGWKQTLYPKDLARDLAFAFVLLPWVLIRPMWTRSAPTSLLVEPISASAADSPPRAWADHGT